MGTKLGSTHLAYSKTADFSAYKKHTPYRNRTGNLAAQILNLLCLPIPPRGRESSSQLVKLIKSWQNKATKCSNRHSQEHCKLRIATKNGTKTLGETCRPNWLQLCEFTFPKGGQIEYPLKCRTQQSGFKLKPIRSTQITILKNAHKQLPPLQLSNKNRSLEDIKNSHKQRKNSSRETVRNVC